MSYSRQSHTATMLTNGKVLVAGGHDDDSESALNTAELFDLATGEWTITGTNTIYDRKNHRASILENRKVLVNKRHRRLFKRSKA